jgi:phosphatidylglycerol:prolipoprotein diacylglycerol transferase
MHPVLFHFGFLTVRTYGVLIALAFLTGIEVVKRAARRRGIPDVFVMDLAVVVVLAGLVGARLFYVCLSWRYYSQHFLEIFKIWEGGLVFYGGFIAATAAGIIYVRRNKFPLGVTADCFAPGIALGQAIGRLGCFFAGCCYGKPTSLPWAVRFSNPASLSPLGVDLHPTQLYESAGDFAVALILWVLFNRRRDSNGQFFWLYVLLYGVLRFLVETLRGDERGGTLGGLYPSQCIALAAVLISLAVLVARSSHSHRPNHAA